MGGWRDSAPGAGGSPPDAGGATSDPSAPPVGPAESRSAADRIFEGAADPTHPGPQVAATPPSSPEAHDA